MAAFPQDWFETLNEAGSIATQILSLPNQAVECVYREHSSGYAGALGQTLKINVPVVDEASAVDEGRGPIVPAAPSNTSTFITINHKYGYSTPIPEFDIALASADLAKVYVAPAIEVALRKLNRGICADMIAANLNAYPFIPGGDDIFPRSAMAKAWGVLRKAGVPMDPNSTFFLTHTDPYTNMMASPEYINEGVVGVRAAEAIQQEAIFVRQYGFQLVDDPMMPSTTTGGSGNGPTFNAVAFHKAAYGLRTVTPVLKNNDHVVQTVVFPRKDVPVVLETWYEPKDQARYIHAFIMCGHKFVRPELAVGLVTT